MPHAEAGWRFEAEESFVNSLASHTEATLIEELAAGFSARGSLSYSPTLSPAVRRDTTAAAPAAAPPAKPRTPAALFAALRQRLQKFKAELKTTAPAERYADPSLGGEEAALQTSGLTWSRGSRKPTEGGASSAAESAVAESGSTIGESGQAEKKLRFETAHIDGKNVTVLSRNVRGDELTRDLRRMRDRYHRVPDFAGSPPWLTRSDPATVRPPTKS